jgi:hypothetical protein
VRPADAVMQLTNLGFHFRVEGEVVKVRFEGRDKPDPGQVAPLLNLVRQHKDEAREFLRCYCPTCGGVCLGTFADGQERCLACHWQALKALNPGLELRH